LFKLKLNLPLKNVHRINKEPELRKINSDNDSQIKENSLQQSELERIKKIFYRKGFEKGKKQAEASILTLEEALKRAAEELIIEKQNFLKKSERQLVEIALAIARKIIRKEVTIDPGIVKKIVKEALGKVVDYNYKKIVVRVNPRDWGKIMQIKQELISCNKAGTDIKIEKDESIQPGGCMVETENQLVNASIEHQLERIGKAILGEEE